MKYGRKVWPVSGAKALEGAEGLVEAYCSVFNNVDYAGEIVEPGFFADTIQEATLGQKALPKILWSHSMWQQPLGITKEAEEVLPYDSRLPAAIKQLGGLRVVGQFNLDTQAGRDAFSNIKMGALDKYSIGYYVLVDEYDRESGVVRLKKGDWLEWSPVNFAANDATLTVGAKGGEIAPIERSEHLYIVRGPQEFVPGSFKREVRERHGLKYTVVTGKLRATGNVEEANIRFEADAWDAKDARLFCEDNGRGTFEPATSEREGKERLAEHGARVVAQVSAYLDRVDTVKSLREAEGKVGRVLSEANRTILAGLVPDLKSVMDRVQKLLDDTDTAASTEAASSDGKGDDTSGVGDTTGEQRMGKDDVRRMLGALRVIDLEVTESEVSVP